MLALLCTIALTAPQDSAAARNLTSFRPVEVSDGPLLFFTRPENETGDAWCVGYQRSAETVYVFDPRSDRAAQVVYAAASPRPVLRPRFLARLTADFALVEQADRLGLLELSTGKRSALIESDAPTELLDVRGSSFYFLESRPEKPNTRWLHMRDVRESGGARRLTLLEFERAIPNHPSFSTWNPGWTLGRPTRRPPDERGFLLITASPDRRVVRVTHDGVAVELMKFDDRWDSKIVQVHESPDRRFLAVVGMRHGEYYGARDLVVVDTTQGGAVVCVRDALPPWEPPEFLKRWRGNPDRLEVSWSDAQDERIDWPGTVFLRSSTGCMLEPNAAPPILATSEVWIPSQPRKLEWDEQDRESAGLYFETCFEALFYRDEKTPIPGSIGVGTTLVSPEGRWASFVFKEPSVLRVLDGEHREFRDAISGSVYDTHWIGATPP